MSLPLQIFIGYDSREPVAYHVLCHSLMRHSSRPLSITPVKIGHLAGCYRRDLASSGTTEFGLARFLVPWLRGYDGLALFLDCDMLCRADIAELFAFSHLQPGRAAWVCQHDYEPKAQTKFLGQRQSAYPRKNWSSVMLLDCGRCRTLTLDYVNQATPMELHRFSWLADAEIGELPIEWNWLVGEYDCNDKARLVHFTLGGPYFAPYARCDYADEWRQELARMTFAKDG